MAAKKNPVGRPPKYKNKEEIAERINKYFEDCKGHPFRDPETGELLRDKAGYPIIVDTHVPTMSGLAYALGMSRQALLYYEGKKEYQEVIGKARDRVEIYAEERLFDKDGCQGAKFSLQNNFHNWDADKPKPETTTVPAVNIICDIPRTQDPAESAADGSN